jgi:hypothetical protein
LQIVRRGLCLFFRAPLCLAPAKLRAKPGHPWLLRFVSQPLLRQTRKATNSNGVATLDTPLTDPDMETLRQKLNELIAALRR